MSEEQLSAPIAKLQDDAGLQEKLKGAADLAAPVALAKEAGFDVSKAEQLSDKPSKQIIEVTEDDLINIGAGVGELNGERSIPGVNNGQITDSVTQ